MVKYLCSILVKKKKYLCSSSKGDVFIRGMDYGYIFYIIIVDVLYSICKFFV